MGEKIILEEANNIYKNRTKYFQMISKNINKSDADFEMFIKSLKLQMRFIDELDITNFKTNQRGENNGR